MDCGDHIQNAYIRCKDCTERNMCPARPMLDKLNDMQEILASEFARGFAKGLSDKFVSSKMKEMAILGKR